MPPDASWRQGISLAQRIDALFRTARRQGHPGEYTYEQVATAIAKRGGPTISASYLYMLRRGIRDNPTKHHLEALADFFAMPVSYFFDTDEATTLTADPAALAAISRPELADLVVRAATLPPETLETVSQLLSQVKWAAAESSLTPAAPMPIDPTPPSEADMAEVSAAAAPRPQPHADQGDDSDQREEAQRIELELSYAKLARHHGEAESALSRLTRLRTGEQLDPATAEEIDFELATVLELLGDLDAAVDLLMPLLERSISEATNRPVTEIGIKLCGCLLDGGDARAAVSFGERALAASKARGMEAIDEHLRLAATVLDAHFRDGELLAAAARARELVALAERAGGPGGQAALLWNSALIAEARGRLDEAVRLSRRALALLSEQENIRDLPRLQFAVAGLLITTDPGGVEQAVALLDAALPALQDLGSAVDLGCWEIERTRAELILGRPKEAELVARKAIDHLSGHPIPETVRAHLLLGDCLAAQGHEGPALAEYVRATEMLGELPPTRHAATLWRELAERHTRRNATRAAVDATFHALDLAGIRTTIPLVGCPEDHPDGRPDHSAPNADPESAQAPHTF